MKNYCFLLLVGLLAFVSNNQVMAQGMKAVPIDCLLYTSDAADE